MKIRDDATEALEQMLNVLGDLERASDDPSRIDRIAALERLRGAVAAAQASEMVELEESQIAEQRRSGMPARTIGRGIPDQLARRGGSLPRQARISFRSHGRWSSSCHTPASCSPPAGSASRPRAGHGP